MSNVRPLVPSQLSPIGPRIGKRIAIAAACWLVVCTLAGIAVAAALREHGSVAYAFVGALLGTAGAIAHAGLLMLESFRRRPTLWRAVLLWFGTLAVLAVVVVIVFALGHPSGSG